MTKLERDLINIEDTLKLFDAMARCRTALWEARDIVRAERALQALSRVRAILIAEPPQKPLSEAPRPVARLRLGDEWHNFSWPMPGTTNPGD